MATRKGNAIFQAMERRNAQMKYIMENLKEPVLSVNIKDTGEFNPAGITWRILNTSMQHNENRRYEVRNVGWFMANIQQYLPKELRSTGKPLWYYSSCYKDGEERCSESTSEILEQFVDHLNRLKTMIEDTFASEYYGMNKLQCLELLKRRYKDWNDISKTVSAKVNTNTETKDNTLEIVIDEV